MATATEVQLVRESWARVSGNPDAVGKLFYQNFLDKNLMIKVTLFKHVNMDVQRGLLMKMIDFVVRDLDNVEDLKVFLRAVGERHAGYGALPLHYPIVGEALIASLRQTQGPNFTAQHEAAWVKIYGFMANEMIIGQLTDDGKALAAKYQKRYFAQVEREHTAQERRNIIVAVGVVAAFCVGSYLLLKKKN